MLTIVIVLTPDEQEKVTKLIEHDSPSREKHFSWKQVRMAFTDWKMYAFGSIYLLSATCMYAYAMFLPTIVVGMGYSSLSAQLMSAPPYGVGKSRAMVVMVCIGAKVLKRWCL